MFRITGTLHNCLYCPELIGAVVTHLELVDLIAFYDCYIDAEWMG